MTEDITLERTFDATPEVVFDAYLDPDSQRELYADEPSWVVESELDLRVGGTWRLAFGPTEEQLFREVNVFSVVDRPRRLAYSTTATFADGRSFESNVDIALEEEGPGTTRMILVHRGLPTPEMREEFAGGWSDILSDFERLVKGRGAA